MLNEVNLKRIKLYYNFCPGVAVAASVMTRNKKINIPSHLPVMKIAPSHSSINYKNAILLSGLL